MHAYIDTLVLRSIAKLGEITDINIYYLLFKEY